MICQISEQGTFRNFVILDLNMIILNVAGDFRRSVIGRDEICMNSYGRHAV